MNIEELKKKLAEVRKKMQAYVALGDMSAEQADALTALNADAVKLSASITALEQLEQGNKELEAQRQEEQDAAIKKAVKDALDKEAAKSRRLPSGGSPYVTQYSDTAKYDNLDRRDLALLIDVQRTFAGQGVKYVNGDEIRVDQAAMKAMALRVAGIKDASTEEEQRDVEYMRGAFKAATGVEPTKDAIEASVKAATDPMYTGGSGIGSDWVGTAYATDLWRAIRQEAQIVGNIPSEVVPDGYSSKTFPLESTDLTWYKVAEATASDSTLKVPAATVTASQIATANKNITLSKLGARGLYTQELEEDSLIRFSSQLREQLEASGREILESVVIDGDTETSANKNINTIDGTPGASDYYLAFDGFRKLALVTNTANSLSAAGGLTIEDFLDTMQLMGTAGLAGADPSKVAFLVDGNVYYKAAKLPEVKTRDVNSAATVENGFIKRVWDVPVLPSWQMHKNSSNRKVNTSGKIATGTPANNTTGAALGVRWDQWKLVYKRRMSIEVTRIANADSWEIVALTRLGLGYRDTEASAVLYNIGL